MKAVFEFLGYAVFLLLALIGMAVVFSCCQFLYGDEITLFAGAPAEPPVCLFSGDAPSPACALFPCCDNTETEGSAQECCVQLFACIPPERHARQEVAVVYCPKWCGVCRRMERQVATGNHRVRVRYVTGDESTFPDFIRAHAIKKDAWPVIHTNSPSGKGILAVGYHSTADLEALIEREPTR